MSSTAHKTRINFHVGAPRIAEDLIREAATEPAVARDAQLRVLRPREYKRHLRLLVNEGPSEGALFGLDSEESATFRAHLAEFQTVVASEHAMTAHPVHALKQGVIMPNAGQRIARLSTLLSTFEMDLHLAITDQAQYLSQLPVRNAAARAERFDLSERVPSWFDLVARIRAACPRNRIIVWDFSDPTAVALPFVMTVMNLEVQELETMRASVLEFVRRKSVLSALFPSAQLGSDVAQLLRQTFEQDLDTIETLDNTVMIRASQMPESLHVARRAEA